MFRSKTRSLLKHPHDPLVETSFGLHPAASAVAPGPSVGEFGSAAAIGSAETAQPKTAHPHCGQALLDFDSATLERMAEIAGHRDT
jgi:hypothetical protein